MLVFLYLLHRINRESHGKLSLLQITFSKALNGNISICKFLQLKHMRSRYLDQWWPNSLLHICVFNWRMSGHYDPQAFLFGRFDVPAFSTLGSTFWPWIYPCESFVHFFLFWIAQCRRRLICRRTSMSYHWINITFPQNLGYKFMYATPWNKGIYVFIKNKLLRRWVLTSDDPFDNTDALKLCHG